jgi:hypothetical protein
MINTVMKERPDPDAENGGEEVAYDEADIDENETEGEDDSEGENA